MNGLISTVIGGLLVAIIAAIFGIGGSTKVTIQHGTRTKKTGKWIIIISVIMLIYGASLLKKGDPTKWGYDLNDPSNLYGITIIIYGVIFFVVGRIVGWYQRP